MTTKEVIKEKLQKEQERINSIDASKLVADVADEKQQNEIVTLPNGVRVRFHFVAPDLLRKVQDGIEDPPVPKFPNPDDPEREIENPTHPEYLKAKRLANQKRIDAVLQAAMLFGIELIDGLPEDDEWIDNLVFLNLISKEDVIGASNKLKEIWYKRFVAIDAKGFDILQEKMGLNQEDVARARKSFQSNA